MSLNGLDGPAVVQAHQAAISNPGGWFLLKYINRDTVDLLGQGLGGVTEARVVINNYEEKSPIYGMVQFRRKKMILKYVPEGTSRLIQVRLVVQFQSILDFIVPHDAIFAFTTPEELSEAALSLETIKLQSTASLTSSAASARNQRLNEITEDGEDGAMAETHLAPAAVMSTPLPLESRSVNSENLPESAIRAKALLAKRREENSKEIPSEPTLQRIGEHIQTSPSSEHKAVPASPKPSKQDVSNRQVSLISARSLVNSSSQFGSDKAPPSTPDLSPLIPNNSVRPSHDIQIYQDSDSDNEGPAPVLKRRPAVQKALSPHLTATASSNISRWSSDVAAHAENQQVRAAPQQNGSLTRPKTAGTTGEIVPIRRISNLPANVRVSSKASSRPSSRQSTRSVPSRFLPSIEAPPLPTIAPARQPVYSPASRTQASASRASSIHTNGSTATPEKLRLMKALQLRKRAQALAQRTAELPMTQPAADDKDNSRSATVDPTIPSTSSDQPPVSRKRKSTSTLPGAVSTEESSATSPVSAAASMSEDRSTKPSSIANSTSRLSLSFETDSSTTPKAYPTQDSLKSLEQGPTQQQSSKINTPAEPDDNTNVDKTRSSPPGHETGQIQHNRFPSLNDRVALDSAPAGNNQPLVIKTRKVRTTGDVSSMHDSFESDVSEDDSLAEEMQTATVHTAKPVAMNRTPLSPIVERQMPAQSLNTPTQRSSQQVPDNSQRSPSVSSKSSERSKRQLYSRAGSARSASTALPQWPPVAATEPVPVIPKHKLTIGATISKRIKVLEGLTQRSDQSARLQTQTAKQNRSSTFTTLLKRSSFMPQSSEASIEVKQNSRNTQTSPLGQISDALPENQSWIDAPDSGTELQLPQHTGETISITARILKPPSHEANEIHELYRSPLIINHTGAHDLSTLQPPQPIREHSTYSVDSGITSPSSKSFRRFSLSSRNSTVQRTETIQNRFSMVGSKFSSKSVSDLASFTEEKRHSRTSRLLKRLSGIGKRPKDPPTSPVLADPTHDTIDEALEPDNDSRTSYATDTTHVVDIGEVNVQFPETLLWKRRFLRIDDQGSLVFAPPLNDHSSKGRSRRIHLSEFYEPCLPEREREEMAWSILLDMKDGGRVQCACESRGEQKITLKMLADAYHAYQELFPSV